METIGDLREKLNREYKTGQTSVDKQLHEVKDLYNQLPIYLQYAIYEEDNDE